MAYTIKILAEISGTTIRTLRWYDEIGLLKPSYYGSNGYRYYEEEQVLLLQQVLYFRELGFQLCDIQKIIEGNNFDKIETLKSHKKSLEESLMRTKELIMTVDKTILHLKGKIVLEGKEMYRGFQEWSKNKGAESYCIKYYDKINYDVSTAESILLESIKNNTENWEKADYKKHLQIAHGIYKQMINCMGLEQKLSSNEVQNIIKDHHAYTEKFHSATKDVYKAMAYLYREDTEYKQQMDPFHPNLANFMSSAMIFFADTKLT
jgi:MerR family transcriptional regulator, thiopeptide resistance regulator